MSEKTVCEDLPEGWVVKISRGRGIRYYFNTSTGQSSWNKPTTTKVFEAKKELTSVNSARNDQQKQKNTIFINKMKEEIKRHRMTLYSKVSQIRKKAQEKTQEDVKKSFKCKNIDDKCLHNANKLAAERKSVKGRTIALTNPPNIISNGKLQTKEKMILDKEKEFTKKDIDRNIKVKKLLRSDSTIEKSPVKIRENVSKQPRKTSLEHTNKPVEINIPKESKSSKKRRKKTEKEKMKNNINSEEIRISEKSHNIASKKNIKESNVAKKFKTSASLKQFNKQCVEERIKSSFPCLEVKESLSKSINNSLFKKQLSGLNVSSTNVIESEQLDGNDKNVSTFKDSYMTSTSSRDEGTSREDVYEEDDWMEGIEVTDPGDVSQIIADINMESLEKFQPVYVVLDTNVLIQSWEFLQQITKVDSKEYTYVCFVVPWVVIQELDSLKQSKRSSTLTSNVTSAIKYVNQTIREKHRMIGQSIQDATLLEAYEIQNNDDNILKCCLQYQQRVKNASVVLCTNDVNLQTKALVSGVNAFPQKDFVKEIANVQVNGIFSPSTEPIQPLYHTSAGVGPKTYVQPRVSGSICHSEGLSLSEIKIEMETVLKSALSLALETEMKDVYDEHWKDIVLLKPPWSLKDIMMCYDKHWIAVFGMFLPKSVKPIVESLLLYAKSPVNSKDEDPESLKIIISQAIRLCQSQVYHFQSKIPELPKAIDTLKSFHNQCNNLLNTLKPNENIIDKLSTDARQHDHVTNTISDSELHNHIAQMFDTVWHVIMQISVLVFDSLGFQHHLVCKDIEHVARPTTQQALEWLYSAGEMLQNIVEAFHRVLETTNSSLQDAGKLLETLKHLLLETKASPEVIIDIQDFHLFCSMENNRSILASGLVQLQGILTMLEQCAVTYSNVHSKF